MRSALQYPFRAESARDADFHVSGQMKQIFHEKAKAKNTHAVGILKPAQIDTLESLLF
jgi:hypothetical protein